MGRMTWHQATLQCLQPVGPGRVMAAVTTPLAAYQGGLVVRRWAGVIRIPRLSRLTIPALVRTLANLALSWRGCQTRTVTSPAAVQIHLSTVTRHLTSQAPESLRHRVISGAKVRTVDQCKTDAALNVTL